MNSSEVIDILEYGSIDAIKFKSQKKGKEFPFQSVKPIQWKIFALWTETMIFNRSKCKSSRLAITIKFVIVFYLHSSNVRAAAVWQTSFFIGSQYKLVWIIWNFMNEIYSLHFVSFSTFFIIPFSHWNWPLSITACYKWNILPFVLLSAVFFV